MSAVVVERLSKARISQLMVGDIGMGLDSDGVAVFDRWIMRTTTMWAGFAAGKLVCVWGLISPTLLSDRAYLWLYTTEAISEHVFLFIRHSQIAVESMLQQYPTIVGHAIEGNSRAIRWLKWLGADFGPPDGRLIPFTIRGKNG